MPSTEHCEFSYLYLIKMHNAHRNIIMFNSFKFLYTRSCTVYFIFILSVTVGVNNSQNNNNVNRNSFKLFRC